MKRLVALVLLIGCVSIVSAQSDWRQPFDAIRIVGNVYYVGTRGLSSFLIVTPAGGIIIDSGEAESVPFIRANIETLGFNLADIKILLTGHAHFDHVGGHADLKRLTGAQVMVMDADRKALESGVDLSALGARGWKAGFDVCDARDAVSALEVLKDCRPAMIVLDIQLPVWTAGN